MTPAVELHFIVACLKDYYNAPQWRVIPCFAQIAFKSWASSTERLKIAGCANYAPAQHMMPTERLKKGTATPI